MKAWRKTCLLSFGGLFLYVQSFVLCTLEFKKPVFDLLLFTVCKCTHTVLYYAVCCRLQRLKAFIVPFRSFQRKQSQRNLSSLDLMAFGWLCILPLRICGLLSCWSYYLNITVIWAIAPIEQCQSMSVFALINVMFKWNIFVTLF